MSARKRIANAVKRSRTVFGSLAATGAMVAHVWSEAVSIMLEAATQLSAMAPVVALTTALGIDVKRATLWLAISGIALSVFARLDDAAKGHNAR
jgi:hypothetical protein